MTHAPAPTVWPSALAAGVTLAAAGVVTSWVLIVAGALLAVVALGGWILDMTKEHEAGR